MLIANILKEITASDIIEFVIMIGSFIGSGLAIKKAAMDKGEQILDAKLKPFENNMKAMEKRRDEQFEAMQLQVDKNYLVNFLSMVEDGRKPDEVELEHFWFTYDDYKRHHGNSYISRKVDKLKGEGKL